MEGIPNSGPSWTHSGDLGGTQGLRPTTSDDPLVLLLSEAPTAINGSPSANNSALPPDLMFDEHALSDIIAYSVLFVIAAVGNLTVFITLFRNRHRKSRVNLMIMHLATADLTVTFVVIPIEIGWRATTQWIAGNAACKIFQFLRAFGLYLSSNVLVCISLDRYFAILHPLRVNDAQRRGKIMLSFAWTIAAVCSAPQSVVFHVSSHPMFPEFRQCVTFYSFPSPAEERTYNLFCLVVLYFLPLCIIVVAYCRILCEISQKSKDSREEQQGEEHERRGNRRSKLRLRRSDVSNIERARARTLRMTLIIVFAFVWCWTPYVIIVLWYMFDWESAEKVDNHVQAVLFMMAVSNSCVNPLVYGTYTINFRNELRRCFGKKKTSIPLIRRPTASTGMRMTVIGTTSDRLHDAMRSKSPRPSHLNDVDHFPLVHERSPRSTLKPIYFEREAETCIDNESHLTERTSGRSVFSNCELSSEQSALTPGSQKAGGDEGPSLLWTGDKDSAGDHDCISDSHESFKNYWKKKPGSFTASIRGNKDALTAFEGEPSSSSVCQHPSLLDINVEPSAENNNPLSNGDISSNKRTFMVAP